MLIVEMVQGVPGQVGFATFDLQAKTWRKLLEVAELFGWEAQGAEYDNSAPSSSDIFDMYTLDYKVEFWNKRVSDADAIALSKALFLALDDLPPSEFVQQDQVLIFEGMSEADFERINKSVYDSLSLFAQFAANGGFSFALDD